MSEPVNTIGLTRRTTMSTTQQEYWQTTRGKKVMKRYARSPKGKKSQKERTRRYVEKLARAKALAMKLGLWE